MQMAIGNAPWPMGVTQVGIHERAGRSRIFSSQIAHSMSDETTRKYIQGLKRLMYVAGEAFTRREYREHPLVYIDAYFNCCKV